MQTLRGGVDADELGATLMHEHVFVVDPEIVENVATDWDEEAALVDACRLDELYTAGIRTIVDLTVIGLGRSVRRLQRVPLTRPLNIVVATGIYAFHDIPSYFKFRKSDVLVEYFVREIEQGIADTGVRAGILKCATDEAGVTPGVEKLFGRWRALICSLAHRYRRTPMRGAVAGSTSSRSSSRRASTWPASE